MHQAVKRLIGEFAVAHPDASIERHDGTSLNQQDVPSLLHGASLFSSHKLVVLSDAGDNKQLWESLPDYFGKIDDTTTIILRQSAIDKRTRTYKWLQKNAQVKECNELDERSLVAWIQTLGHDKGINLEPEIARLILAIVGYDQWRLHGEISKLALVKGPLSRERIIDTIEPTPQATAFELLDATIARRPDDTRRLLASVRLAEDPYKFVGLLTSQVYALAVCHAAGNRSAAQVAKDAGIHPYVASKTMAIAKRLDKAQLKAMITTIAELDISLKSLGGDPWMSIEASLMRIALR